MSALRWRSGWIVAALVTGAAVALAQAPGDVRIDITTGQARRLPIRVEPLAPGGDRNARGTSLQADEVLAADLAASAAFQVTRSWVTPPMAPEPPQGVVGGRWTVSGSNVVLKGQVLDFPARRVVFEKEYRGGMSQWRRLVHQFADDVVLQFTGSAGVASTRIAFVVQEGRNKELWVMDADGHGPRPLTADRSLVQSPAWSPDGSHVLFTSYRDGRGPRLWSMSVADRRIGLVSGRPGLNTSGAWSPDGREIACTLSQDGNAEIYVMAADGSSPRRLTSGRAIDTSPTWSPTGQEIAFTSDRGGSPQVYVMDREGGNVRRLTFEFGYTDSPAWSPGGDRVAFVSRNGNGFDVRVCRADGSGAQLVATGGSNENPRWSPDGRHLVFSSTSGGATGLFISDLDGSPPRRLDTGGRRASSPAWSPRPISGRAP